MFFVFQTKGFLMLRGLVNLVFWCDEKIGLVVWSLTDNLVPDFWRVWICEWLLHVLSFNWSNSLLLLCRLCDLAYAIRKFSLWLNSFEAWVIGVRTKLSDGTKLNWPWVTTRFVYLVIRWRSNWLLVPFLGTKLSFSNVKNRIDYRCQC